MCHADLDQLCTLFGVLDGSGGGRRAMIPGTHRPAKMVCKYWTPGHPVGCIAVIDLPCNDLGRHLDQAFHIFGYLKAHPKRKLVFDPAHPAIN